MKAREFASLVMETVREWQQDQASRLAAALAYYATFSLAPLLVLVIAIAGLLGGRDAAEGLVMSQIEDLVGVEGREFVQSMVENAAIKSAGITASIVGMATLLLGALGAFNELQNALDRIWDVEPKPIRRWSLRVKRFIFKRLLSFSMVLGVGFLLLVSLVISAALSALSDYLGTMPMLSKLMLQILNLIISVGLITLLFAMIFKFVPDIEIGWRNVWLGAALTAVFFTIGKTLIGIYLGRTEVGSSFGAAGSLALIMIWVYYSSQILFLGAEFTQVFAKRSGSRPRPGEHAVGVKRMKRVSTAESGGR
ncbi:MAG TPA: YihY/virulence factor BrkB family protein [Anaerolineales bacterium]|nr:YihY/virulence factor BrkB family protein [Anaerolineales bacterium]